MSQSLQENLSLALRHELRIRECVGRSAVLPASLMVDQRRGTDLLILSPAGGQGCAARVRRGQAGRFSPWEFTIRSRATGGGTTEYEKFRSGECNWMFYGVLNEQETDFATWMLINLAGWRMAHIQRDLVGGFKIWGQEIPNRDGSAFYVYSALSKWFVGRHDFMVDCSDDSYPGRVAARDFRRAANDNTLRRFMRKA